MDEPTVILLCRCANRGIVPDGVKHAVLAGLKTRGDHFTEVDDLCGVAAASDTTLRGLAGTSLKTIVVACHPRAVKWLLHAAGLPIPDDRLKVLDMRALPSEAILDQLPSAASTAVTRMPAVSPAGDDWQPWFPVIDQQRCKQCRQCVSFCLFGVYELSPDGKARVANPRNCKNNCPACARICPEAAIIFPKLDEAEAPLNGAEVDDEADSKVRARINVKEILGDDVYQALAERRRRAGARRLVRPARGQAEQERAACSAHSHGQGAPASPAAPTPLLPTGT